MKQLLATFCHVIYTRINYFVTSVCPTTVVITDSMTKPFCALQQHKQNVTTAIVTTDITTDSRPQCVPNLRIHMQKVRTGHINSINCAPVISVYYVTYIRKSGQYVSILHTAEYLLKPQNYLHAKRNSSILLSCLSRWRALHAQNLPVPRVWSRRMVQLT